MNRFATSIVIFAAFVAGGCACGQMAATRGKLGEMPDNQKYLVSHDTQGIALQGYDPVAYFTDKKPVKGDPRFKSAYNSVTYQFASADHKSMFDAAPARYEPQFGGYCGYAASINKISPISPEYWEILDGRLVLQHNERAWKLWHEDVAGNLKKADANWPGLVRENGTGLRRLINTNQIGIAVMGYDVIAYRTDKKPVMGDPKITAIYNGATYQFASVEHKNTFEQNPAKYVPGFGGYCGYAASINKVSPINPAYWQIIDDRLVLQHTDEAYKLFNKNAAANLVKADNNWPGLVECHGR